MSADSPPAPPPDEEESADDALARIGEVTNVLTELVAEVVSSSQAVAAPTEAAEASAASEASEEIAPADVVGGGADAQETRDAAVGARPHPHTPRAYLHVPRIKTSCG
jgi:hypothetical protein